MDDELSEDGIRDPLHVSPDGDILDGCHRYKIAQELGMKDDELPLTILEEIEDEREKKEWIIKSNLLRRQLDTSQKYLLYAELSKNYEEGRGFKGDRNEKGEFKSPENDKMSPSGSEENTRNIDVNKKTAKIVGKSAKTIERARKYAKIIKENPQLREENPTAAIRKYENKRKMKSNEEFQTPEWVADLMTKMVEGNAKRILEPTPGQGNIVNMLEKRFPKSKIVAPDDFFELEFEEERFDLVVGNPPFSPFNLAYDIFFNSLQMADEVIMLMPWLTVINSVERTKRILNYGLKKIVSLPRDAFQGSRVQTCVLHLRRGYRKEIKLDFELENGH